MMISLNRIFAILFLLALVSQGISAEEPSARWHVEGLGFFKNRSLKNRLDIIFAEEKTHFSASDIEDAALVLISALESEGFLKASAIATLEDDGGKTDTVNWDSAFDVFLPRDTAVLHASFKLQPGPRFYYEHLNIIGSEALEEEEVAAFFYAEPLMFQNETSRVFTPSLLNSGAGNLQAHLNLLGYQEAEIQSRIINTDDETGVVRAEVRVSEGPLFIFRSAAIEQEGEKFQPQFDVSKYVGQPYSRFLVQDILQDLRYQHFEAGYPDVSLKSEMQIVSRSDSEASVSLLIRLDSGEQQNVGEIAFLGTRNTKRSALESRVKVKSGDPFNPALLDRSRLNLSRLGVFNKVEYEYEESGPGQRSIQFLFNERYPWSVDTFVGWGSYEQLRAGVQAEKINIRGLGHRLRFRSILSLKSALGETRYLMPDVFGSRTSIATKLFALDREEVSFDREEIGVDVAASRRFENLNLDVDAVYTFQSLEAISNEFGQETDDLDNLKAGSVELRIGRDRRDNPLNPKSGYRFFGRFEYAAEVLGGDADYQRADMGISYHGEFSRGLYWHGSLTHGVIGSFSEAERQVPTNKLFFPGGENSVRGYQRGEAAPIDAEGKFQGARSYLLLNLELEQMLSDSLSFVVFLDGVGTSSRIGQYPFNDTLLSAGAGLRFRTFMGPIRFEYGHNLNRRLQDPDGTFHFALGYPF